MPPEALAVKNMVGAGVGGAFLKTGFELQDENPQDDIQIAKLLSKITTVKRQITQNIKKAKDTAGNVTRLKSQEGVTETSRITTGMLITGVGYIEAAKREIANLEEASNLYVEMMADVVLKKPDLRDDCDQKIA